MYTECWVVVGPSSDTLVNIEATLVSRPVIAVDAGVEESCVGSVLSGVETASDTLVNIEATLVSRPVIAVDAGVEESCVGSVLSGVETASSQLTGIEPAMGCDSGPPLTDWTEIGWVGLHRVYRRFTGKYRMDVGQSLRLWGNEKTLKIYILTSLLGPFLNYILDIEDSCPWRRPIHLSSQKIWADFLSIALIQPKAGPRSLGNSFSNFS